MVFFDDFCWRRFGRFVWFRSRLLSRLSLGAKLWGGMHGPVFYSPVFLSFVFGVPARKIAQLHCRFIFPETAIAVYAPFFFLHVHVLAVFTISLLLQPAKPNDITFVRVNMNFAVVGKNRPICNEHALKGSECLDGMKVQDCMLQKFFRLRDRLCRLRALRSHEIRLHRTCTWDILANLLSQMRSCPSSLSSFFGQAEQFRRSSPFKCHDVLSRISVTSFPTERASPRRYFHVMSRSKS